MATQTLVYRSTFVFGSITKEILAQARKRIKHVLPRPCMIVSVGLLFAGLSIPFLMSLALIPASLFLGFLGMSITCTGIVLTFYNL